MQQLNKNNKRAKMENDDNLKFIENLVKKTVNKKVKIKYPKK